MEYMDRRTSSRVSDLVMRVCIVLLMMISGGLSWGLKEIYISLRTHEREIIRLNVSSENDHKILEQLVKRQGEGLSQLSTLEARVSSNEVKIDTVLVNILKQLSVVEAKVGILDDKLDRVIETGILNENKSKSK